MSWFYRHAIRPVLFTQKPEVIHELTIRMLAGISRSRLLCGVMSSGCRAAALPVNLFGLDFPNPVGLAAGMDKEGLAVRAWAAMGFGFSELGAATWHPQPGNPRPRVFRAIADEAVVNRMGFNNPGAAALAQKLAACRIAGLWPDHPVGINLGKSKITALDQAAEDYAQSLQVLLPHADFFVVNVSSPNTPNLRRLQDRNALDEILAALQEVQAKTPLGTNPARRQATPEGAPIIADSPRLPATTEGRSPAKLGGPKAKPILVKVAPDLTFEALDEILGLIGPRKVAGIVATNTTLTRPTTDNPALQRVYAEAGGLSGRPLRARSTEIIRHLYRQTRGTVPLMGVGGIFSAADAWEKITAGASLLQLYTGLVYEGPFVVKTIVSGLKARLAQEGSGDWKRVVGRDA